MSAATVTTPVPVFSDKMTTGAVIPAPVTLTVVVEVMLWRNVAWAVVNVSVVVPLVADAV